MYWGHLGHFHRAISHLKWYKIVPIRYLACTFSQMKSINMFSTFLQYGVHRHFLWRFITVWIYNLKVFMFMYVNVDLKLYRQYAETWVFEMFSCCVHQGKYILGLGNSFDTCHLTLCNTSLDTYLFTCSYYQFRLCGSQIFAHKRGVWKFFTPLPSSGQNDTRVFLKTKFYRTLPTCVAPAMMTKKIFLDKVGSDQSVGILTHLCALLGSGCLKAYLQNLQKALPFSKGFDMIWLGFDMIL